MNTITQPKRKLLDLTFLEIHVGMQLLDTQEGGLTYAITKIDATLNPDWSVTIESYTLQRLSGPYRVTLGRLPDTIADWEVL